MEIEKETLQLKEALKIFQDERECKIRNREYIDELSSLGSRGIHAILNENNPLKAHDEYKEWCKNQDDWERDVYNCLELKFSKAEALEFRDIGFYEQGIFPNKLLFSGDREGHARRLNILKARTNKLDIIYETHIRSL